MAIFSRKWLWLALLACAPTAHAGINNPGSGSGSSGGATGSAQLNIGSDLLPANFINVLQTGSMSFFGGATPGTAALDVNGYPTQSFTGSVGITFNTNAIWPTVNYTFSWTSGTKLQITNGGVNSGCSVSGTGGTTSGCSGGNVTLTIDGTGAGSMTWNPSTLSLNFLGAGSYGAAGTANLRLTRASDALASGYITPEYKATLTGLNPKTIRTMGIDQINSIGDLAKWIYRATPTSVAWTKQYPLRTWSGGTNSAGTITGTDQYTSAAAPDTSLAGWVANETLMGAISNPSTAPITVSGAANNGSGLCRLTVSTSAALATNQQVWVAGILDNSTSEFMTACSQGIFAVTVIDGATIDLQGTTFSGTYKSNTNTCSSGGGYVGTQTLTITGKTGGAKFIGALTGYPTGAQCGPNVTASIGTFVYDAVLDRVLYSPNPILSPPPIEVEASIANAIHANLWPNIPPLADDDFVINWATTGCSYLNSALYFQPEYANEVWNFGFFQTSWALNRGTVFGFPQANSEAVYGWYGLRVRQIMGNLIPSACGAHLLRRTLMFQGAGNSTNTKTYRFNGADLAPSGTSTGKGNTAYSTYAATTCGGTANCTASPNRPIDVVETIGYAPYTAGTNFSDQGSNGGTVATAANAAFLQTLATAFNSNPSDPTSIASLDNDQRQGTYNTQSFTCPSGNTVTLASHGFTNTASNGNMVALFTASGGSVCNGLSLNTAYCFIGVTTNTFQIAAYTSAGVCGSTPISMTPGTGTSSVGAMNNTTILAISSTQYPEWETVAASYDGGPASPKRVELYEGADQPVTPSVATLTSLGVTVSGSSTTANTALAAGLIGWKNSSAANSTVQYYFSSFVVPSSFPHSKTPSWLVLPCGNQAAQAQYALLTTCFPNSTPYQLYNGFAAFSGVP